jgi:hypothetical protein
MLRSKSVQQQRPNNTVANTNTKKAIDQANNPRSNSNVRPRPSSMYDGAKQGNKFDASSITGKGKEQPKKATAFGHSVASSDKKNDQINSKVPSNPVKGNGPPPLKSSVKPPVNRNLGKGHDDDDRGGGLGMNGFAKLQNKVKNQPLIMSYEEDEMQIAGIGGGRKGGAAGGRNERRNHDDHDDYGGGGGDLNLELRGQSRYIPVNERIDDFDDHSSGGGGGRNKKGDQIDKLLSNARKGKYA